MEKPFAVIDGQLFINSAIIKDACVSMHGESQGQIAKASPVCRSANFEEGVQGWEVRADGSLRAYGARPGSTT